MATLKNTTTNTTSSIKLPVGSNSDRPSSALLGMMRFNTDIETVEIFDGSNWSRMGYSQSVNLANVPATLNETTNRTANITVNATGYLNGTSLYWTITGGVNSNDFSQGFDGSFTLSGDATGSTGNIAIEVAEDFTPEGSENFQVEIRSGSTSGPIIETSSTITIADTSTEIPPGEDLRTQFWSIGEFQNNDGASDTSAPYSVSEVSQAYSGSGRLYLIHKATGSTSFYNDVPIACIQVLDSSGTTVNEQWWFGLQGDGQGWQTNTSQYDFGPIGSGINIDPDAAATNYSYTGVTSSITANRFGIASSTTSSGTGAVDGISQPTGPMTLGEESEPQSGGVTYYMYRETSGASVPQCSLCRSPSRTWSAGEIIRIAYIIGNFSTNNYYTPTDTLFFGISPS